MDHAWTFCYFITRIDRAWDFGRASELLAPAGEDSVIITINVGRASEAFRTHCGGYMKRFSYFEITFGTEMEVCGPYIQVGSGE